MNLVLGVGLRFRHPSRHSRHPIPSISYKGAKYCVQLECFRMGESGAILQRPSRASTGPARFHPWLRKMNKKSMHYNIGARQLAYPDP